MMAMTTEYLNDKNQTQGTQRYIREEDVVIIRVPEKHIKIVKYHTDKRIEQLLEHHTSNPHSNIHKNELIRYQKAPEERELQMGGEYSINVYVYNGYVEGCVKFDVARTQMNNKPLGDDGGKDVLGYYIDVKTSLMRTTLPAFKHLLSVTKKEKERDSNNIFVLALCHPSTFKPKEGIIEVHLIGWCYAWEIDIWSSADNPYRKTFEDKWVKEAWTLHPMKHMPTELVKE